MNPVVIPPPVSVFQGPEAPSAGARSSLSAAVGAYPVPEDGGPSEVETAAPDSRDAHFLEAAERLSAALFHVVHQPTAKSRDRSLGALVALIYGPTPFGGVNSLKEVASRYGMTEQNLFQLMRTHRELLSRAREPEYQI